ncbi:microsomal glutathione S-transferase 1-like [Ptychodera flava]|uniref:microsomal glutathione S-transferase 1-like n=1 Tax=Ptychodera flava TaxID=63121 RepID=UPI00396A0FFC
MAGAFNLENEVFKSFLACGAAVVIKMQCMGPITSFQRAKHKAWTNPEDARARGKEPKYSEDVERVRRCHLNDLENIPAFLALGAMYVATNPSPTAAIWHFRVFLVSRILHTFFYLKGKQPGRAICYIVGALVNVSMAIHTLCTVFS